MSLRLPHRVKSWPRTPEAKANDGRYADVFRPELILILRKRPVPSQHRSSASLRSRVPCDQNSAPYAPNISLGVVRRSAMSEATSVLHLAIIKAQTIIVTELKRYRLVSGTLFHEIPGNSV